MLLRGEYYLQIRLSTESIESMLGDGYFEISARSENMIEAFKDFDNGKIHLRMKRENSKHSLEEHFYWVVNFHYEHGIRPTKIFESDIVQDFAKKYVTPYVKQGDNTK